MKTSRKVARNPALKNRLRELEERLRSEANRSVLDLSVSSAVMDDAESAVTCLGESVKLEAMEREYAELVEISHALASIEEGSYGHCEICDRSINPRRLAVLPFATRCINCQRSSEKDLGMPGRLGARMPEYLTPFEELPLEPSPEEEILENLETIIEV